MTYKSLIVPRSHKIYELNILDIYDWRTPGNLIDYFEALLNTANSATDKLLNIAEFGVHNGRANLSTSLFLKQIKRDARIYAYDTWEGFPSDILDPLDGIDGWKYLQDNHCIDQEFLTEKDHVAKLYSLRKSTDISDLNALNISTSGNFSNTSLATLKKKISYLGIENIKLIQGDFSLSLKDPSLLPPSPLHLVLMDCDLYKSYASVLPKVWPLLASGGQIYLDEYFSYKFPGARIASDKFISSLNPEDFSLDRVSISGDFERFILTKMSK